MGNTTTVEKHPGKKLLTVDQVAEKTEFDPKDIRKWAADNGLARVGSNYVFTALQVKALRFDLEMGEDDEDEDEEEDEDEDGDCPAGDDCPHQHHE